MNQISKKADKKRNYEIKLIKGKKVFIKEYKENITNIKNLLKQEYQKGIKLWQLINYPKPLKVVNNKIMYEYIDIKYSLYDRLNKGYFDFTYIEKVAKYLRKIHDNNIIHGDFNTANIVITNNKKLFFIDSSFSKYTNRNTVIFKNKDIYQDLSLFIYFLKWKRPLYSPWLFFQRKKIRRAIEVFLNAYFQNNPKNFNSIKNALMENRFFMSYLKSLKDKKNYRIRLIIWKILIKFLIYRNRSKYEI